MNSLAIIGAQWGDEGKGKITDYLGQKADYVVRFQGGNNAGHTIWVDGKKTVLHVIPSGVLHAGSVSVIDHGVVLDPENFVNEINGLKNSGVDISPSRIKISTQCNIITSYHRLLDAARETKSSQKIGTTKKGIGPAYEDRTSRKGVKCHHLLSREKLAQRLEGLLSEKRVLFEKLYEIDYPTVEEETERLFNLGQQIKEYVTDTFKLLSSEKKLGKSLLFEGSQGVLLDVDFGSYPYVTSSNTAYGGIFTGSSNGGKQLDEVIGIVKAYTTRVGEGPFPTQLDCEHGQQMGDIGHEFGATTGRKRRCGWLDLPLLKYATNVGRFTSIALTKVDVLAQLDTLKVCYAYELGGEIIDTAFPGIELTDAKPLFKELKPFTSCLNGENLDQSLEDYIQFIESELGVPVSFVAYGPERKELFQRKTIKWQ